MSLPRKPRAVIFDLDGTLIDSETLVREAHFAACKELGFVMSDAQFLAPAPVADAAPVATSQH